MKKLILSVLLVICLPIVALASTVVLQWDPNTEPDLAGYKVYQRQDTVASGSTAVFKPVQTVLKGAQTATIPNLDPAQGYSFAITAYNTAGMESGYSNVVAVTPFPKAPTNVRAISILITP